MKALISDIHGNLEALRAVLEDVARHPVEAVYCLGDTVGYGPDPRACFDLVRQRCEVALLGNHDQAVVCESAAYAFNPVAERSLRWTRGQIEAPVPDQSAANLRRRFLAERPPQHREGGLLFVHASPCNPVNEYVFPDDAGDALKMGRLFGAVERCCFVGHTHMPGVFVQGVGFFTPGELGGEYPLDGCKALVNVGSVGQPRDGDPRACYVLREGETVRFRRVEYDARATAWKIVAAGLDESLASRVVLGR